MSFYNQGELDRMNFRHLGKNVLISDKCSIYNPGNISIDDNSRIDDFAILSAGDGGIEIGKYVHIACFSTLIGKGKIKMCDYSGLSSRVAVYSSSDNYNGEWMTNPCLPSEVTDTIHKEVFLGKHVVVGSGSVILPGVTLEEGVSVGALSLVNKSFSEFQVIAGSPAKSIKERSRRLKDLELKIK